MLELVEEALDAIALLVEVVVVGSRTGAVLSWRDDDLGAGGRNPFDQVVRVVALVGDGYLGGEAVDEFMREGDVVALSGRADQAERQAEGLGGRVDLGAQAAARPAQALGIRPPLTLRAPAACW